MKNNIENKKSESTSAGQDGFLEIIIIIVIALLIMKYFGVTISGVIHWFTSFFSNVLK
jgi:hypothetical protein